MADHYQQSTVTPNLPMSLMTNLETMLLEQMFESEEMEATNETYFFAQHWIETVIDMSDPDFVDILMNDTSLLGVKVRAELASAASPDAVELCDVSHTDVFQAIIARHPDRVPYVIVETACTCSRMLPGQFGGRAELITATEVHSIDTGTWLARQVAALP